MTIPGSVGLASYSKKGIQVAITQAVAMRRVSPKRKQEVKKLISGKDVFVCLPTVCGKFLCYCLLPAAFDTLRGVKDSRAQSRVIVEAP